MNRDPFQIISEEAAGIALGVLTLCAVVYDSVQRLIERFA